MIKKFCNIFKRDKTGFSNEELEWQAKIGNRIENILYILALLSFMLVLNKMEDKLISENYNVSFKVFIMKVCICTVFLILIYGYILLKIGKVVKIGEIKAQLQRNLKKETSEKVLSCIQKQEISKLEMEWPLIKEVSQMLFQSGMVQVKPFGDREVMVRLSEATKNANPFFIRNEELLNYFNVKMKEDNNEDEDE